MRDLSLIGGRGDKIAIIGPNGAGKTTLLQLLLGQLAPRKGSVRHGTKLEVARFDQHREELNLAESVAENIAPGQEYLEIDGKRRHVYGYLQDFLFTPEQARTPVAVLSGGERNRLLLARILARPVNLLILDELGFVPFDKDGGELLFNLLADRYERRSTIVTTNLDDQRALQ